MRQDPNQPRAMARLYSRAVKQRWPVNELDRAEALSTLLGIIRDESQTAKTRNQAIKTLVSMESQNQKDERLRELLNESVDELLVADASFAESKFLGIAHKLGIVSEPASQEETAVEPSCD
jgi:hypothetical protein